MKFRFLRRDSGARIRTVASRKVDGGQAGGSEELVEGQFESSLVVGGHRGRRREGFVGGCGTGHEDRSSGERGAVFVA